MEHTHVKLEERFLEQSSPKEELSRGELKQEALAIIKQILETLIEHDQYIILQYGSSLFGSETKDSDFDIIIVVTMQTLKQFNQSRDRYITYHEPNQLRQSFFFGHLMEKLSKSYPLSILKAYDVTHAKVPILKIKYKEALSLDVSLGIVQNDTLSGVLPSSLMPSDDQTENVLQAVLICQEIQQQISVTDTPMEIYSQFLQYIKQWAQQRKIYGQQYAFLGGIQWAILCANLLIQYSQIHEYQELLVNSPKLLELLLCKFFKFYSKWEWPNPINLLMNNEATQIKGQLSLAESRKNWNPISSVSDSQHLMPIITPELPRSKAASSLQVNSAECILQSSLQLYESEFERAYRIMRKVQKQKLQLADLFSPYDSFMSRDGSSVKQDSGYHFVIIISVITNHSGDKDLQTTQYYHTKFLMTVESKVRSLLVQLDKPLKQSNF